MTRKTLIFLMLLLTAASTAMADRARPTVSAPPRTFLADNGQMLRGGRHSTNLDPVGIPPGCSFGAPSCAPIDNLKNFGLNALHVYSEGVGAPIGTEVAAVDQMVNWTGSAGLYMVLVIGGGGDTNGEIDDVLAFWQFYAPRYKDRTHVLYEIKNEPDADATLPVSDTARELNRQAYATIRGLAPQTPILLYSNARYEDGDAAVSDINFISPFVDWSNTGVAFHGYQAACPAAGTCNDPSTVETAVNKVRQQKPNVPLINTEFYRVDPALGAIQAKTQMYEDRHVSWLSFLPLNLIQDSTIKAPIDSEEVVWNNEWGLPWPAVNTPPVNAKVTFRAKNGAYAGVDATNSRIFAIGTSVGNPQKFIVKKPTGTSPTVCLQSFYNNKYAWPNTGNAFKLEATVLNCANSLFEWMQRPNGAVVLRAMNNLQTVDANVLAGANLIAKRIDSAQGEFTNFTVTVVP